MTIKELLDIQQHDGVSTIKIQKNIDSIIECIDDMTGFFVASKRVEPLINEMNGTYVDSLKKAVNALKIYEKKALNEEEMTQSAARILAYDVHKYLAESYNSLTSQKRIFKEMNKENISKVYSSLLFEFNAMCKKYNIILENIINDDVLLETVSDDMSVIVNEVL